MVWPSCTKIYVVLVFATHVLSDTVADPKKTKGGVLPPDCATPGTVRTGAKFICARAAKQTEKRWGPGHLGPPPGSATADIATLFFTIISEVSERIYKRVELPLWGIKTGNGRYIWSST